MWYYTAEPRSWPPATVRAQAPAKAGPLSLAGAPARTLPCRHDQVEINDQGRDRLLRVIKAQIAVLVSRVEAADQARPVPVGIAGGQATSAAINAIDAFTFPNTRTFTLGLSTSF